MILNVVLLLALSLQFNNAALTYDYYTGKVASQALIDYYKSKGILDVCTIDIEPCCASEWRRIDGSCYCFQSPTNGTFHKELPRLLPAFYYNGSYPRKAYSGKELEWPRIITNVLLAKGKVSDCAITQLVTSFGIYQLLDVASIHDIENFLFFKTDCCMESGLNDYECAPNYVPRDDSLNRLGDVQCLNLTRPLTFQNFGCTNDSVPSPFVRATSAFDSSQIYNFQNLGDKVIREFYGGLLIMEEENGMTWPQGGPSSACPLNQPDETRCFAHHPNILVIQTLFVVWFTRYHNYCAREMALVNPCWDDETLYQTCRDIVISFTMQVYLYEWSVLLQGRKNLEKAGVISKDSGFRNINDPTKCPSTTLELTYIMRYFHTAQEATAKLYDREGTYVGNFPLFNLTTNTGFMVKDNYMEEFTQGQFRQASGKIGDNIVDYDVGDNGLPRLQKAVDITSSDLHKARLFGLRPYVDYVKHCTGHNITSFDDLKGHIDECKIEELKKVYEDVRDIDLMAGIWVEKLVPGGMVPNTFACIFNDNINKAIRADRHWYELEDRPHAFTAAQLLEIRNASLATLLCAVGDGVTKVQKNAFLQISPKNPLKNCSEIPYINFKAWADPNCTNTPPCTTPSP